MMKLLKVLGAILSVTLILKAIQMLVEYLYGTYADRYVSSEIVVD